MKIRVYAALKEHFETEFDWHTGPVGVEELKARLRALRPGAGPLLDSCRFAAGDRFIDKNHIFHDHETVNIIPPASGG